MPSPLFGIAGGMLASRLGFAGAQTFKHALFRSPIVQGGQFGVGYTGGAYLGYGGTNTADPLGLHKPKYRYTQANIMPYGSYGRRRYSRYSGRSMYSGYTRYRRYRRRRPYYSRRSYY